MKRILVALLLMLSLSACQLIHPKLDTHNARSYGKDSPVLLENDTGIAVMEDGLVIPYAKTDDHENGGALANEWYRYNFKTAGIDEREAKQLRWLAGGYLVDYVTTVNGLSRGCVELNSLARGVSPAGMAATSAISFGFYYVLADGSSIYQDTTRRYERLNRKGAAVLKWGIGLKNLNTLRGC